MACNRSLDESEAQLSTLANQKLVRSIAILDQAARNVAAEHERAMRVILRQYRSIVDFQRTIERANEFARQIASWEATIRSMEAAFRVLNALPTLALLKAVQDAQRFTWTLPQSPNLAVPQVPSPQRESRTQLPDPQSVEDTQVESVTEIDYDLLAVKVSERVVLMLRAEERTPGVPMTLRAILKLLHELRDTVNAGRQTPITEAQWAIAMQAFREILELPGSKFDPDPPTGS